MVALHHAEMSPVARCRSGACAATTVRRREWCIGNTRVAKKNIVYDISRNILRAHQDTTLSTPGLHDGFNGSPTPCRGTSGGVLPIGSVCRNPGTGVANNVFATPVPRIMLTWDTSQNILQVHQDATYLL